LRWGEIGISKYDIVQNYGQVKRDGILRFFHPTTHCLPPHPFCLW
jgi:hypothetical protein